jgi:glycerol-3-phosphate acyltransferase PlsY
MGATNMLRTGGRKAGVVTLILDVLKGVLAATLGLYADREFGGGGVMVYVGMMMSIVGHCFPAVLKFRGGKGVATYLGGLILLPQLFLIAVATWLLMAFVFRYSSLAALTSVIVVALYSYRGEGLEGGIFLSMMAILIVVRHCGNVLRLLRGEEDKISLGRKRGN